MAIGIPYNLGTGTNKIASTITITTVASVPANDTIILAVCTNTVSSGDNITIADDAGNTYQRIVFGLTATNTSTIFLFHCIGALALGSASTITITNNSAATLMSASALGVNGINDKCNYGVNNTLTTGNSTTPSGSSMIYNLISGTPYLALAFGVVEGPNGDTFTQDSGYNAPLTRIGTTGGAAGTNRTIIGGYQLSSSVTFFTYGPTLGTAREWATAVLTYQEAVPNTLYWVPPAGAGSFDAVDATNWSTSSGGPGGGGVPTGETNVVFNAASTSSGSIDPTFTIPVATVNCSLPKCKNLTVTGITNTVNLTFTINISSFLLFGNLTMAGSNFNFTSISGAPIYIDFAGGTTQTVTSNGYSLPISTFATAASGTVISLQDDLLGSAAIQLVASNSQISANNNNVEIRSLNTQLFASQTINMGSGKWTITNSGFPWSITGGNTVNSGRSTLIFTATSGSVQMEGGSKTYWDVTVGGGSNTSTFTVTGGNSFRVFKNSRTVAYTILFAQSVTNSFSKFDVSGTAGNLVSIGSQTPPLQATLQRPGNWNVGANSTNVSNNTGLTFAGGGGNDYLSISNINGIISASAASGKMFALF